MEHMLDKDVERVLFSEEELHRRVAEIAAEIDRDYAGREPLLVSVLRGSFVFMADLVRQIHLPCTVDFMAVSSYGAGTASSGQVRIIKDLSEHIEGRDVIVVEDILDSGNTLSYLLHVLEARHPASIKLCTLLDNCGTALDAVELIAVAAGPGSFTGLRIGVAAAKGLAWPGNKPCAACSTLESMAWCLAHLDGEICAVMDARRNQVYNARFRAAGGRLERLCPDRAVGLDALADELKKSGNPQFLVGDGALLCYTTLKELGLDIRLAPPHLRHQSAWGVARCALELTRAGRLTDAAGLTPNYHRLSQAERERLEKEQHKGESCHGHGKSTHFGPPSAAAQAVHPAG